MKTIAKHSVHGGGVAAFLAALGADVTGTISGYDRLRLRGSLRAGRKGSWFTHDPMHGHMHGLIRA